jgi:hypothetical protein
VKVRCYNCDWHGDFDDTDPIEHFWERVSPGEPVPAGQCPECGSLCGRDAPVKGLSIQESQT